MEDLKEISEKLKQSMIDKEKRFNSLIVNVENESNKNMLIEAMNKAKAGKLNISEVEALAKKLV